MASGDAFFECMTPVSNHYFELIWEVSIDLKCLATLARPVVGSAVSLDAVSAGLWHPSEFHDTPISGFPGDHLTQEKLNFGLHQGIAWLDFGENNNIPCYLGINARNLDGQSDKEEKGLSWQKCDAPRSILSDGFSENPRFFVRGIEVCTSGVEKNFERVKSFRVTAAKVWQTRERVDELERRDDDQPAVRPTCARWRGFPGVSFRGDCIVF